MDLGWLDVCLKVSEIERSRAFYERLGFRRVEGDDTEGWAVLVQGESRIGLYAPQFMESEVVLNFRGGNVAEICHRLDAIGTEFSKPLKVGQDGGASATLKDPDGHIIFLDCAPGETKPI